MYVCVCVISLVMYFIMSYHVVSHRRSVTFSSSSSACFTSFLSTTTVHYCCPYCTGNIYTCLLDRCMISCPTLSLSLCLSLSLSPPPLYAHAYT